MRSICNYKHSISRFQVLTRSERRRPTAKWWDAYDQRQQSLWWATSIAVRLKNDVWCPCYVEFCTKFWIYSWMIHIPQDLYSVSSKTPYRIILWSREAARFGFRLQVTFKNMGNQSHKHIMDFYINHTVHQECVFFIGTSHHIRIIDDTWPVNINGLLFRWS